MQPHRDKWGCWNGLDSHILYPYNCSTHVGSPVDQDSEVFAARYNVGQSLDNGDMADVIADGRLTKEQEVRPMQENVTETVHRGHTVDKKKNKKMEMSKKDQERLSAVMLGTGWLLVAWGFR